MKSDLQLKEDVLSRLELEPKIDPAQLGVSVANGVVTLSGRLETDEDRACTERAVRFIKGVKGLVDDELQVQSKRRERPKDSELQACARQAIEWLTTVPGEHIHITAQDGWITLEGEVEARHQADCIEELVREMPGVRGVKSSLRVPQTKQAA